jgi:hypothetical protein
VRRRLSAPLVSFAFGIALLAAGCGGQSGGSSANPASPSPASSTTTTSPSSSTGGPYAYVQDVKPILTADCTRCHAGSKPSAGLDLSTYAGVMRVVAAGNANSTLVQVTRSGGAMYSYLSGDRAAKSEIIRQWVVSGAPETR